VLESGKEEGSRKRWKEVMIYDRISFNEHKTDWEL
jgi:predicted site-specific integrase-resolvase